MRNEFSVTTLLFFSQLIHIRLGRSQYIYDFNIRVLRVYSHIHCTAMHLSKHLTTYYVYALNIHIDN